jgi:uncharacterized membrane protein YphA (DoxX/SURF4 family)
MSNKETSCHSATHCIGLAFGALILRLWIGMRLLFAGLEKWKTKVTEGVTEKVTGADGTITEELVQKTFWKYDLGNAEVYTENMGRITSSMNNDSPLRLWMIEQFGGILGWMLLIVGAWVILGLFSRAALVAAGFVFLSLTFGLATIGADPEIVERGIEIGLVVAALALARYQVFGVDGLIRLAMGKSGGSDDDKPAKRQKD